VLVEGGGIPLGRVLAGAHRHDSPLLEPTLDRLAGLGPLPAQVTVHLDAGYDSIKTRTLLADRGLHGEIAHKGEKAPTQASRRWHVERTNAWHNGFNRFQRCYERRERVIERLLRPRRCDHHRPSLHPTGLDHPPLGQPDPHGGHDPHVNPPCLLVSVLELG
jgi:transposase